MKLMSTISTKVFANRLIFGSNVKIVDIDWPLYECGILFRYDFANYFSDDESKKRKHKVKCVAIFVWLTFNIIRYLFYAYHSKDGRLPKYLFDVTQDFGTINILVHLPMAISVIFTATTICLFNLSHVNNFKWYAIILTLKSFNNSPFHDRNLQFDCIAIRKRFVRKIKFARIMCYISAKFISITALLLDITSLFVNYKWEHILYFGIIATFLHYLTLSYGAPIFFYSFLYYYIVIEYCKLRLIAFNNYITNFNSELTNRNTLMPITRKLSRIEKILMTHNEICHSIEVYNRFWMWYYFALTYTLIPTNLMCLQQIIVNDDQNLAAQIFVALFLLSSISSHILLNKTVSDVHKLLSNTHISLYKLYTYTDNTTENHIKIKVRLTNQF